MGRYGYHPNGRRREIMRLESFCRFSMRYLDSSWHRPYGPGREDGEGLGFGQGDGSVTGEIEGTLAWANYPRRRQDGVWMPNLRGTITLGDGSEILVSIHGQSVQEREPASRRAILARAELTTEAASYRWLNTCFLVGEGEIDEEREHWWLDTYVCVNEQAKGPPALGKEPPPRFRQRAGRSRHRSPRRRRAQRQPSSGATYFRTLSTTCALYSTPSWFGTVSRSVSAAAIASSSASCATSASGSAA